MEHFDEIDSYFQHEVSIIAANFNVIELRQVDCDRCYICVTGQNDNVVRKILLIRGYPNFNECNAQSTSNISNSINTPNDHEEFDECKEDDD